MDQDLPLLAGIRVGKDQSVDAILEAAARALIGEGVNVVGYLQRETIADGDCCDEIELEDITSGKRHLISQALGKGARGCRLDPVALAAVAGPLVSVIDENPDLLILNRFGKGESEGQGFRAAIEAAYASGIPVLVAVREAYVDAWQLFAGELGILLPPDHAHVLEWMERIGKRHPQPAKAALG